MIDHHDMPCRELVELVSDYIEWKLTETERQQLEAHLKVCIDCRRYVEQIRQTIRVVGKIQEPQPVRVSENLLKLFRDWRTQETASTTESS